MARVAGVNLPETKRIEVALTYIYGVGLSKSQKVLKVAGVKVDTRVNKLSNNDIKRIGNVLKSEILEGELKQQVFSNIKRLKDIRCYRGNRHKLGLPVRGQQTRTNAVTRKGKNIAVGGLKRKIEKT